MPAKPSLTGRPDDLVYIHVLIPLWLKRRAVEKAKAQAQDMTGYFKALLVADLGDKKDR